MTNENNAPAEENALASAESEHLATREIPETDEIQSETQIAQSTEEISADEIPEAAKVEQAIPSPPEADIPTSPIPEPFDTVQIEILDVRVFEPEASAGVSILEKKLVAELRFRISSPQAEVLTVEHHPFQISIYTIDLKSNALNLVAFEEGEFKAQEFEHTTQKEFPVPKPGSYAFHSIVLLLPPYTQMESYQGPILRVVP